MDDMAGDGDEGMGGADENQHSQQQKLKQHNQQHDVIVDDSSRLRVTKSRANELNHAKCILKLTYTKFEWSEKELLNFHRPNIAEIFEEKRMEAQRNIHLCTEGK